MRAVRPVLAAQNVRAGWRRRSRRRLLSGLRMQRDRRGGSQKADSGDQDSRCKATQRVAANGAPHLARKADARDKGFSA